MTGRLVAVVVVALCGCVALVVARRRPGRSRTRLRGLSLTPRPARAKRRPKIARLAAVAAGIAVALLVSGWPGLGLGLLVGVVVDRAIRRIEPAAVRAARERAQADLPFALDLTAAALSAGAPAATAARAVGTALGGQLGELLDRVGRSLALGAAPVEAWSVLTALPGAERFAATAVRGSQSGAALSRALLRLADDLRSARLAEIETTAHRAEVLVVLPLGLCFLPAFIAGGLIPVVISMLGTVLP